MGPNALFDANWIALVAASVAVFFLNAICYSAVWDEYWFRLALPDKFKIFKHGTAEEKEKLEREMMKHFPFNLVVSFVTTLVTCIGYSAVVAVAKPEGLFEFVLLSWFIPILFVLQADFGASVWQQKPTGCSLFPWPISCSARPPWQWLSTSFPKGVVSACVLVYYCILVEDDQGGELNRVV